jgi:hypothetical protein
MRRVQIPWQLPCLSLAGVYQLVTQGLIKEMFSTKKHIPAEGERWMRGIRFRLIAGQDCSD